MEQELFVLTKFNPAIAVVIYTLDFKVAAGIEQVFEKYGIRDMELLQIQVSKLTAKNSMNTELAPWIITGKGAG
ncbi:MAG: hypothetical protein J5935_00775 [Lachnospiraceae bacterium]|nr:hypothetical protein [Lachnospiraceae bacterium]